MSTQLDGYLDVPRVLALFALSKRDRKPVHRKSGVGKARAGAPAPTLGVESATVETAKLASPRLPGMDALQSISLRRPVRQNEAKLFIHGLFRPASVPPWSASVAAFG